jgi:prevent-host-death family protein
MSRDAPRYYGHVTMVTKYPRQGRPSKVRETRASFGPSALPGPSREIPAGEFKARCLSLMDDVQRTGGEYVITKRGVPVARLLPASVVRRPLLGSLANTATTLGDLVAPMDEAWDALEAWDGED